MDLNDTLTRRQFEIMCAINGIYAYHYAATAVSEVEVLKTRESMASRGPDGAGFWSDDTGRIALAHRRLAVIDLSGAGRQPMQSACGRFVITFQGEIYNHRELRNRLQATGIRFRTSSDTEVLLELYKAHGTTFVRDLRGMFAFAIWDTRERILVLARDPFGIKPLYYADDGWVFRFASQVKALLAGGGVSRDPCLAGQAGFYLWGAVPEPYTTYREARALPAGSIMVVDQTGQRACRSYLSVCAMIREAETKSANSSLPPNDTEIEIAAAVKESVDYHLVSDVPVGAFLSSGIDSGALVGLMRDCSAANFKSVTLRFEEFAGHAEDEGALAAQVAKTYNTHHTERVVTRTELEADLPRIFEAMDQPSIDGINSWFVAKAAREQGIKVAISGVGGDELFGGYPSFAELPQWVSRYGLLSCLPLLGDTARLALSQGWRCLGLHPKAAGMIKFAGSYADAYLLRRSVLLPWEVAGRLATAKDSHRAIVLGSQRASLREATNGLQAPYAKVAALELNFYLKNQLLRDTDWATMAHGVETRLPLVDHVLLRRIMPLLLATETQRRKEFLARAPGQPLPPAVLSRPKTGFSTPMHRWISSIKISGAQLEQEELSRTLAPWSALWARRWACIVGQQEMTGSH